MKSIFVFTEKLCYIAAAVAALSFAACKNESSDPLAPAQTYTVSGKITTSEGIAAQGASVTLRRASDGGSAGQSPSNAAGEYIITGVSAGNYTLTVSLNGCQTAEVGGIAVSGGSISKDITLQKITLPVYTISGSVYLPDGSAAAGASVQALLSAGNTPAGQAANTGAQGAYSIGGITAGSYNLVITLDGFEAGVISGLNVSGADLTVDSFTLQAAVVSESAVNIVFAGSDASITNLPADGSITAARNGAHVTISSTASSAVELYVTGTTSNGSLKVQDNASTPSSDIHITLNSAVIASASDKPPVLITKNTGVTIVELKGSSILADHSTNAENAALISNKGSLEITGYGRLNVSGAAKHAIASKDRRVNVRGGNVVVASAVSDGIHAEDGFEMSGGSLDIASSGDGIDGGSGEVIINGGSIRIASVSDDVKGIKADAGITINAGAVEMSVSGAQSKGIGSKADITIAGGGISIVTSGAAVLQAAGSGCDPSYCTAVKSDGNISVSGGSINIEAKNTADGGKGISADGDITVSGGIINITTAGSGRVYTAESGTVDSYTAACIKSSQNISLLAGKITCSSSGTGGKGVNADGAITIGNTGADNAALELTVSTSGERFLVSGSSGARPGGRPGGDNTDYANPKAIKCGGNMQINSGTLYINCSQHADGGEGLESKAALTINGGSIDIHTYDDCINAVNIVINNGNIYCAASGNDAIDTNGSLTLNGGMIIANGVRGDGEAFDADRNVQINGGVIVGTSGNTMSSFAGSQKYYRLQAAAGSAVGIKNAAGEYLLLFTVPVIAGAATGANVVVIFSDPRLAGGSYTLQTGGSISGGVTLNGYNTGGTYAGGASRTIVI